MSSSNFSPSRGVSPANSRLHQLAGGGGGGIAVGSFSRLRSSSLRKPPEPLRRAVADCLSSSATASFSSPSSVHGNPAFVATEASRTLRDYVSAPATTDLAYSVILEYTIAERERSPAVVARCVALLKRYLLRYKPSEETLIQIDRFCMGTIAECDINANRKSPPWSCSLNQQSVSSVASTNSSPLPVSAFASGALVKSLSYVRSLVAQQIPKRISQAASFTGGPPSLRHSLPTFSSVLSRSLSSQLNPSNIGESSEDKDSSALTVSNSSNIEKTDATKQLDYIAVDVFKWRWLGEHHLSISSAESMDLQTMRTNNIIESGAAALFVGDIEAKLKGQPWKYFGTADMPYLDQLLQPSSVTTITNAASARSHLRAITASKRNKASPSQIWEDSAVSTFRPRAKPLFQYRPYGEQQPLRLNPAEVGEVIMAVSSETYAPSANHLTMSSRLSNNSGKPSMDVAVSVLIKLIIDMYILDSGTAAPLTLFMLEEMLSSPKAACRVRAFDLILNLGVHAHLLEPMMVDDTSTIEEDYPQETFLDSEEHFAVQGNDNSDSVKSSATSSAIDNFESWILNILYEILLLLVQREDKEESVWSSALSCLLYFVCDRGKILRSRLEGLDIRVIKTLIEISRANSWAELVHGKLICMLTNVLYQLPDNANDPTVAVPKTAVLLIDQVNLIGGIEFILYEYSFSNFREERRNLFLVLFEYVLRQINEDCVATGVSEYSEDEINPLVTMLALADAPEVFYISVKLGVEGLGELLRRSISDTLDRYSNNERLKMLLDYVMEKFEALISSHTHLDEEFSRLVELTKTYKFLDSIKNAPLRNGVAQQARLSWATLHSLLHSDRIAYRQNGYTWLGDLLIAEVSEGNDADIWSNIKSLQRKIVKSGDCSVTPDIPLSISLMCGLLKSKNSVIRWGFLHILERFLMRCKFLLDENEMQVSCRNAGHQSAHSRLEKANAVVDIMSSALSLVAQITETDRINILKMCDILFSQLCLKVGAANSVPSGENAAHGKSVGGADESKKIAAGHGSSQQDNCFWNEVVDESDSRSGYNTGSSVICETASMAALLLQGKAIVPMQLVARVPTALFYWPLLQLAGAATDNIALGVAVGSKGRGNLPGATSDIRATLLLLLIGKCTANSSTIKEVGGEDFFRELLDDTDSRVAYYSSGFLLKRMMSENPDEYQHKLQNLVFKAQQSNNEKLLENPYLQMRGIIQLSNDGL